MEHFFRDGLRKLKFASALVAVHLAASSSPVLHAQSDTGQ
jgi:hypothetical protein